MNIVRCAVCECDRDADEYPDCPWCASNQTELEPEE
jgi:hypothetical protein